MYFHVFKNTALSYDRKAEIGDVVPEIKSTLHFSPGPEIFAAVSSGIEARIKRNAKTFTQQ